MPDQPLTDERLRDHAFEQATLGDIIGARQTISKMIDRKYLREAWITILGKQMDFGDLQGVKETIAAFSNDCDWLLSGHWVQDTIMAFARAGDVPGAIEIANKADGGGLFVALIALFQAGKGDFVGARETASHLNGESWRSVILDYVRTSTGWECPRGVQSTLSKCRNVLFFHSNSWRDGRISFCCAPHFSPAHPSAPRRALHPSEGHLIPSTSL